MDELQLTNFLFNETERNKGYATWEQYWEDARKQARLLLAAPALLAACKAALEELASPGDADTPTMTALRAAIALAQGDA